jgi:transcriptional regulator with XRE-family HTH domain
MPGNCTRNTSRNARRKRRDDELSQVAGRPGLAELRKALGLTQAQVAERMSVTKSRVSQIERGEVSTIDAVARYVQAVGGYIQISAVFGDDLYILRGTVTEAA